MIWPYLFSLTLWKTVSCASPGDAALEVQLALWKQFLRLCSAPGPTLCALTGFSINKTLPLSPETLSSKGGAGFRLPPLQLAVTQGAWIWSSRAGAASSQSSSQKLPCWWRSSSCTTPAGCDGWRWQQQQFYWQPNANSSSPFPRLFLQRRWCLLCGNLTFAESRQWWKSLLTASFCLQLQKSSLCWSLRAPRQHERHLQRTLHPTRKR